MDIVPSLVFVVEKFVELNQEQYSSKKREREKDRKREKEQNL